MNSKIKKILAVALAMIMIMAAVSCGDGEQAENSGSEIPVYTVATEATFPPFDTVDEDGNIIGFDMDLITAIGEDQGFQVEFVDMSFEAIIPSVQAGNSDIIAAGMWAEDPERREKVDFSDFYYNGGKVLIVKADNDKITDMSTLTSEMKVASQIGTNYADEITALEADGAIGEAVILDGFDTCVLQLLNEDIDAILTGYSTAVTYENLHAGKIKIAGEIMDSEALGFAVQKGNKELLEQINTGLANVRENGIYDELLEKWGL